MTPSNPCANTKPAPGIPGGRHEVIQAALGPIYPEFLDLKRREWQEYHRQVTSWEVERYLTML